MGFKTLFSDNNKKKGQDDRKVEEFQQGGAQSGTAVLRPVPNNNNNNIADEVIRRGTAQAHDGRGRVAESLMLITVYANGFLVSVSGREQWRDLQDPTNQEFMRSLSQGIVPEELEEQVKTRSANADIGVDLIDKRSETYIPPFMAFTGQGHSLSSPTTNTSRPAVSAARPIAITVDNSARTATVQVVAANGSRLRVVANPQTHTVLDLYQHIMAETGDSSPFELMGGFPPKTLSDMTATIDSAGLAGASVRCKKL